MNNLGERIYILRTKREMSQGDLAEKLDVSRQTISKWENNISVPELDKLLALSDVFGVTVDYIVKGEGEIPASAPTQVSEPVYEAEPEKPAIRMITVDPTKKLMAGLSVSMGVINILPFIMNIVQRISILSTSPDLLSRLESWPGFMISTGITLFFIIALLSRKEKLISASLIIMAVYAFVSGLIGFNQITILYKVTTAVSIVAAILIAVGYIKTNKKTAKLFCTLIIVFVLSNFAIGCFASYNSYINSLGMTTYNALISVFNSKIWSLPTLFLNIGMAVLIYLKGNPKPTYEVPENAYPARNDMYVGMVKHILLLLFTLGIYECIWIYKTTENLNFGGVNQIQSGVKKLLLCIFVPFYRFYWYYAQSKRLETIMKAKGMYTSDFAVVTLILSVFIPIVAASAFLQVKINEFAEYGEN